MTMTKGRARTARLMATAGMLAISTMLSAGVSMAQDVAVVPALHDAVPEEYKAAGIKVAAFNDWPPDEFMEDGVLKGWSIDMANAMSAKLGVPFTIEGTSFDVIIPGLASGRYDAGFSSFGVTEERLAALDFIPQRLEGTAYASLASKPVAIATEADLCGHSVAVLTGAWDFQYLTDVSAQTCADNPIDLQQFTTQNAAELAVSSGRVELVAAGSAKLLYMANQTGTFAVSEFTAGAVYNGIGVPKGDPIGPLLRDALQSMMDDGSYQAIMEKWGVAQNGMLDEALLVTAENYVPEAE